MSSGKTGTPFAPLARPQRLPDQVVEAILAIIVNGEWQPGDRLPSERDLSDQFGVSRTVIREAVRSLAAKGVLDVKTGSGATVIHVDAMTASESLRLFIHTSGLAGAGAVGYDQINDVREMIETRAARIAATVATEAEQRRLRHLHEAARSAGDDIESASQADLEFHRAIADSAHNPLYGIMLDSIRDVLLGIGRLTIAAPSHQARSAEEHAAILDRIEAGDAVGAEAAMTAHLDREQALWQRLQQAPEPETGVQA